MHRSLVATAAGAACLLALAPAAGAVSSPSASNSKTTICHATGSAKHPYVRITVSDKALKAHRRHQDGRDIIPAPAGGCPKQAPKAKATKSKAPADKSHAKVTICHATGSATNPYVLITIAQPAVAAHRRHQDGRDIIPAPVGADGKAACPAPAASGSAPAAANGNGSPAGTQSTNGADNGKGTANQNANANGTKTPASGTAPTTASGTAPSTASGTAPSTAPATAPKATAGQGVKGVHASKRSRRKARHAVSPARAQAFTG